MIKKLKSSAGETLIETLCALLIVVLAMTMLAGAIVSAARVNKGAEELNTAFLTSKTKPVTAVTVTVDRTGGADTSIFVNAFKTEDDNEYCYYTTN